MPFIRYTLTRPDRDFDLTIEYEVAPYFPGNTYGPPENCDFPEGGEVTSLLAYREDEPFALTEEEQSKVEDHIYSIHDYSAYY